MSSTNLSLLPGTIIESESRISRLSIRFKDGSLYRVLQPQFAQAKSAGLVSGYKLKPHGVNGAIRYFNALLADPSQEILEGIQRTTPRYQFTTLTVQHDLMLNGSPGTSSVIDAFIHQVVCPTINGTPTLTSSRWLVSDNHSSASIRWGDRQGDPCIRIEVVLGPKAIKNNGPKRLPRLMHMDWSKWLRQFIAIVVVHKGRAGKIYRQSHGLAPADPSTCRKTFNRYLGNRMNHVQYMMHHPLYKSCLYDQTHYLLP